MYLENQVCSLDLSKRLKELGVKQDSLFCWMELGCKECGLKNEIVYVYKVTGDKPNNVYSAFTVAELGEMLPRKICQYTRLYDQPEFPWMKKYSVCLNESSSSEDGCLVRAIHSESDDYEANARAKMLIYLLENKLMELPI